MFATQFDNKMEKIISNGNAGVVTANNNKVNGCHQTNGNGEMTPKTNGGFYTSKVSTALGTDLPDQSQWSRATVVLGAQWGDEGKGKIVDLMASEMDVVGRCQVSRTLLTLCFYCQDEERTCLCKDHACYGNCLCRRKHLLDSFQNLSM